MGFKRVWHPECMKRFVIVGGAALLLVGAGNATTGPSLRVASTKPFVVKGAHFKSGEGVLVRLTIDRSASTRRARAVSGSFTVSFGTVGFDRCSSYVVRAIGARGDGAVLRHPPLPMCAPAVSP
jgi:hypothetical protein